MTTLPTLMVAPNGARLGKEAHPALPVTLPEIIKTARACFQAGANGLHLHLRAVDGGHILDAGLYREALAELSRVLPDLRVQITTESVGLYEPEFQRRLALATGAGLVSAAYREITADGDLKAAAKLHQSAKAQGVSIQYILYAPGDLAGLAQLLGPDDFSNPQLQLLFVLGGHGGHDGAPGMLHGFLDMAAALEITPDWGVCAFGQPETACLAAAHRLGGKLRVGFENSFLDSTGRRAPDNAARVAEILSLTQV